MKKADGLGESSFSEVQALIARQGTSPEQALLALQESEQSRERVRDLTISSSTPKKPRHFSLERAISEFSDALSNIDADFESKVLRVLRIGCRHLGLEIGTLVRIAGEKGEVIVSHCPVNSGGLSRQLEPGARFSLSQRFCLRTAGQDDPYSFEISDPSGLNQKASYRESYIGCVVKLAEDKYGTLNFSSRKSRGLGFSEAEKAFVKLMARNVGNELNRVRVAEALRYRTTFEKLITSISTEFINLGLEEVDDGIRKALGTIAEFAGVDLSYVFLFNDSKTKMDITHWWDADKRKLDFRLNDVSIQKYAWSMEQILNREVAYFYDVDRLPHEAAAEKRFSLREGVKSAIIVPMIYSKECIGLVGFASRKGKKDFDDEIIKLLKMVGHILASAVRYKKSEEAVRNLEAQMLHAQKLDSLGVLAGGIAHDFNNLLMGVLGNAGLALNTLPFRSPARSPIQRIEKITQHAAVLTNKLLAYAGRGKYFVEVINLSSVVADMVELLGTAISKRHTLNCNFATDLPAVEGDPAQISQVVMNLITNASDAIGEQSGEITLSTGLVAVDRHYLMGTYLSDETPEGVYVYLQIKDSGCGMDRETISKIFDPFFTTKFAGHGLGLAAVLGIVRGHGGTVKVRSAPGEGTAFTVLFPCSDKNEALIENEPEQCSEWQGNGLLLVVDDEESVREVVAELLRQFGFEVITAHNGETAVKLFAEHGDRIDATILDMTMPDMSGCEVLEKLRQMKEDAQVLLTSGYSEHEVTSTLKTVSSVDFIQKPYRPQVLIQKVFEVLKSEEDI